MCSLVTLTETRPRNEQAPARELAVVAASVTKRFGDHVAVRALELRAPSGQVTVIAGPNGAGKTTALRLLTGALIADEGDIEVLGSDPRHDGEAIRSRTGVVSAKPALYDRLSGWDNLRYSGRLHRLDQLDERAGAAARRFGIHDALDQRVGGFSTGMKTRLALARAVLHEPDLLLLDEPTSGLDPESAQAVLELIHELTHSGHTVVMCTHLLHEAEGLADQLVVLDEGGVTTAGRPTDLARELGWEASVRFRSADRAAFAGLERMDGVLSVQESPAGEVVALLDDHDRVPELVATLVARGVRLSVVEPHEPRLAEVYAAARRRASTPNRPAHP